MFPLSFLKLAIWFFSEILIVLVWAVLICWYTELCLYICNTYIFEWMQYPNEYMKTVPEWGKNLSEIFFGIFMKSAVSRIVPKNVKGGPFGIFGTTILLQNIKIEAGTLWRHWKHLRKKSHKAEIPCTKILVTGGTRTHVLLLDRPQKILVNLYAKWQ